MITVMRKETHQVIVRKKYQINDLEFETIIKRKGFKTLKQFKEILNNPQHNRHRIAFHVFDHYEPISEKHEWVSDRRDGKVNVKWKAL